jgi:hypothetical protein
MALSADGEAILRAWERAQTASMVDLDPLVEAIIAFTAERELKGGPAEIVKALRVAGFNFPEQGAGKSVARKLREATAALSVAGVHSLEEEQQGKARFTFYRDRS